MKEIKEFLKRLFCFHEWKDFKMKKMFTGEMETWQHCPKCHTHRKWDMKKKKWVKL